VVQDVELFVQFHPTFCKSDQLAPAATIQCGAGTESFLPALNSDRGLHRDPGFFFRFFAGSLSGTSLA
jgi:hypothetical protein